MQFKTYTTIYYYEQLLKTNETNIFISASTITTSLPTIIYKKSHGERTLLLIRGVSHKIIISSNLDSYNNC